MIVGGIFVVTGIVMVFLSSRAEWAMSWSVACVATGLATMVLSEWDEGREWLFRVPDTVTLPLIGAFLAGLMASALYSSLDDDWYVAWLMLLTLVAGVGCMVLAITRIIAL